MPQTSFDEAKVTLTSQSKPEVADYMVVDQSEEEALKLEKQKSDASMYDLLQRQQEQNRPRGVQDYLQSVGIEFI